MNEQEEIEELFKDFSKRLEIEVESKTKLDLIRLMLDTPIDFLLTKNIYSFLKENYNEIIASQILTIEETEKLKIFIKNYDVIMEAYDLFIEDQKNPFIDQINGGGVENK